MKFEPESGLENEARETMSACPAKRWCIRGASQEVKMNILAKLFREALGFDSITSILIFSEYDSVLAENDSISERRTR